jgi:hypothetical protein
MEDPPRSQYAFALAITCTIATALLALDSSYFLYFVSPRFFYSSPGFYASFSSLPTVPTAPSRFVFHILFLFWATLRNPMTPGRTCLFESARNHPSFRCPPLRNSDRSIIMHLFNRIAHSIRISHFLSLSANIPINSNPLLRCSEPPPRNGRMLCHCNRGASGIGFGLLVHNRRYEMG